VLCDNCGRWTHRNSAVSALELNEERTDIAAADVFDLVRLRIAPEYRADRDITVDLNFAVRRFDADFAGRQEDGEMCRMRMHSITTDPHTGAAVVFKHAQPIVFKCNAIVLRLALNGVLGVRAFCDDEH